jgi:hypothetical protein
MSKKKGKKARKAAKKRARALKSLTKAVGLTVAAFSAGLFQEDLKKRAVALVQSVLGRIEGLRETYSERMGSKEETESRRESRPNGVMAS